MQNTNFLNYIKIGFLVVGGFLGNILGGWDVALKVLIFLTVCDFITGVLASAYLKKLDSNIGYKGLIKKISIYIMVAVAFQLDNLFGQTNVLRMAMIFFYIAVEGISVLENVGKVDLFVPSFIKDLLVQVREKADKGETK